MRQSEWFLFIVTIVKLCTMHITLMDKILATSTKQQNELEKEHEKISIWPLEFNQKLNIKNHFGPNEHWTWKTMNSTQTVEFKFICHSVHFYISYSTTSAQWLLLFLCSVSPCPVSCHHILYNNIQWIHPKMMHIKNACTLHSE